MSWKKFSYAVLCALLVVTVILTLNGGSAFAYTSLPYIEKVVGSCTSGGNFNVLEIVPSADSGSIGYYIDGAEPFANQQNNLYNLDENGRRNYVENTLFPELSNRGLISDGGDTPLSTSGSAYTEKKPWEMTAADYASMNKLTLESEESGTATGKFNLQSGGGYRENVNYTPDGSGDRVQIINYFVNYNQLDTTDNYYFYSPAFVPIVNGNTYQDGTAIYTNTATDGVTIDPNTGETVPAPDELLRDSDGNLVATPDPDGYVYYDTWNDNIELDSNCNYYMVTSTGAPSSTPDEAHSYAAISNDYRLADTANGEQGYFTFTSYQYVGLGSGSYAFESDASGTSYTVYYNTVYYHLGYSNNNWYLRYVLDRDDNYFAGSGDRVSLSVTSIPASRVTAAMVKNADLIVLSGGFNLSDGGSLVNSYLAGSSDLSSDAANAITTASANLVPVVVDHALVQVASSSNIGTLAAALAGSSGDDNFVSKNLYFFTAPLATNQFHTPLTDTVGFESLLNEIENENFLRKQADPNTHDLLPDEATIGNAIRYIINYQQQRQIKTKDSINVLELQPGNVENTSDRLTEATVRKWLGNPTGLTTVNIESMSTSEFIGKIDDLVEKYDLIYIGDSTDGFHTTNGTTVYNDSSMNGLLYTGIGDEYHSSLCLGGLLNSDFTDTAHTILNATSSTTANLFRFSGNDLTATKAAELKQFARAGYPIVCADSLIQRDSTVDKTVGFSAGLSAIVDNNKAYFTASVTLNGDETLPATATITYKLYKSGQTDPIETMSYLMSETPNTAKSFLTGMDTAGNYYCTATITDSAATGTGTVATSNTVTLYDYGLHLADEGGGGINYSIYGVISTDNNTSLSASLGGDALDGAKVTLYNWEYSRSSNTSGFSTLQNNSANLTIRSAGYYRCTMTVVFKNVTYNILSNTVQATQTGNHYKFSSVVDAIPTVIFDSSPNYIVTISGNASGNTVNFSSSLSWSQNDNTYSWQKYTGNYGDSNIHFGDIGGANSSSYSATPTATAECYRLCVTYNKLNVYSNVIQVTKIEDGTVNIFVSGSGGSPGTYVTTEQVNAGVNTNRIDSTSNMYDALNTIWNYDNVMSVSDTTQNSGTLLRYTNLSKPSIVWTDPKDSASDTSYSYPTEYKLNSDGTTGGLTASADGKYYLVYTFSISNETDPTPSTTTYDCKLYLDLNSDGLYKTNEEVTDIIVRETDSGSLVSRIGSGSGACYALKPGVSYTISRQMPDDYVGIIPWKLEVIKNGTSSYIHASQTNYTHITPSTNQVTTIKVLQIMPNNSGAINLQEQLQPGTVQNAQLRGNNGVYYTGIYGKLLSDVKDFNVQITTINISQINVDTEDDAYNYFNGFDMLIIGFYDMYGTLSTNAANAVMRYIASGDKSVLFTHDTTSLSNLANGANTRALFDSGYGYVSQISGPTFWGYSFNTFLRNAVSLDRYGITSAATIPVGSTNQSISSILKSASLNSTEIPSILSMGYNVAYEPKSGNILSQTQGYTNYSLIRFGTNSSEYKYTNSSYSTRETTYISQVNKGQITTYPYDINTADFGGTDPTLGSGNYITVSNTHEQYYQLNLNSDNIVVWYCLSGGGNSGSYYSDLPNDVLNSYYIYSKGNVTYSGVGHTYYQSNFTSSYIDARYVNEAKLFVNTMIAAYRTVAGVPTATFTSDATSSNKLNYYFVTSDYSVSNGTLGTTGDILGSNYKLFFRLTDPSLNSNKAIGLSFSYKRVINGVEENTANALAQAPIIYSTDSNSSSTVFSGGLSYYILLPQEILDALEQDNCDSVRLYLTVGTNLSSNTSQTSVEIRRVGLFELQ